MPDMLLCTSCLESSNLFRVQSLHDSSASVFNMIVLHQVLSRLDKDNIQATTELKNQHASEIKALKDEHASALAQVPKLQFAQMLASLCPRCVLCTFCCI